MCKYNLETLLLGYFYQVGYTSILLEEPYFQWSTLQVQFQDLESRYRLLELPQSARQCPL